MLNNDIPENPLSYRKDFIIESEIRLLISADINNKKTYILVEGNDDINLLRHMMNDNIDIIGGNGKESILKIVKNIDKVNCIGIVDRDYEDNYNNSKIFLYDYCCLEMMIISDEEIMEKISKEFKINSIDKILDVLFSLLFISLMRKYNYYHKLNIDFGPLNGISNYYDKNKNKINNNEVILLLEKIDKNRAIIREYNYKKSIAKVEKICKFNKNKLLKITNGHNFLNVLSVFIKNKNKNYFWYFIRGAYNKGIFNKTKLYKKLSEYGERNNLKIL